jgi:GTP-binding protein
VLLHLIDLTADDPVAAYDTVRAELEAHGGSLSAKPEIVALNKADALTPAASRRIAGHFRTRLGKTPLLVSGVSRQGVDAVLRKLVRAIAARRRLDEKATPQQVREAWRP